MSDPARKWLKAAAQALVSACLVILVARQVDLQRVLSLASRPLALPWLLGALLLFNLSKGLSALRLNIYQRHAAIRLSEGENLRLYYTGMFLNMFLPGGIGGDGYKVMVLYRRHAAPVGILLGITLADRASGLLVLLMLLCLFAPFIGLPWPADAVQLLSGGCALAALLAAVLMHRRLLRMDGGRTAMVLRYGLAVQLLQLACMVMLLRYLQVPAALHLAYLSVFLASSVAAVVPLTVAGLGAREITFLYGLQLLQFDPAPGIAASSGFFLITVISSLPGALFLQRFAARPAPGDPALQKMEQAEKT